MRTLLLLALLAQDPPPTDKDGDAAVAKLREEMLKPSSEAKIAAIQQATRTRHEKVCRAIGGLLIVETDAVRIAAASALVEIDHPATAQVLADALRPNLKKHEVLRAILKSIGEMGWQNAVDGLNGLLNNIDPELGPVMPDIVSTIGQLRSLESMDPLIDLLSRFQAIGRRIPWNNEEAIARETENALRGICPMDFRKAADWSQWYRAYKEGLRANVERTYWLRKTQTRVVVARSEKIPEDAVLAFSRLPAGKPNVPATPQPPAKKKAGK